MASGKQLAKNLQDAIKHRTAIWDETAITTDRARYEQLSANYPGSIQFEARKAVADCKTALEDHIRRTYGVYTNDLQSMLRA